MTPTGLRVTMLAICAIALVSLVLGIASIGSADTSGVAGSAATSGVAVLSFLVLLLGIVVLWGMGLYLSARTRAWGWFLNDLLYPGIALPLHALFGPVNMPSVSPASFVTNGVWMNGAGASRVENMQMTLPLPPALTGMWMLARRGTEAQAKAFFWNEFSSSQYFTVFVQQQLQRLASQGWKLANQLGPANVQTRTRGKFTADPIQRILIAVAALTILLIPVALFVEMLHYRQIYEPSSFTFTVTRPLPSA